MIGFVTQLVSQLWACAHGKRHKQIFNHGIWIYFSQFFVIFVARIGKPTTYWLSVTCCCCLLSCKETTEHNIIKKFKKNHTVQCWRSKLNCLLTSNYFVVSFLLSHFVVVLVGQGISLLAYAFIIIILLIIIIVRVYSFFASFATANSTQQSFIQYALLMHHWYGSGG